MASAVNCENPELGSDFTNQLRTLRNALPDFNTPVGKHLLGQVNALEQHKAGQDHGPMRDAIIALETYFSKTLGGEWDGMRYTELSKCKKEPVQPMTGPDMSSTRWG